MTARALRALVGAPLALVAAAAHAQAPARHVVPEARLDGFAGRLPGAQAAAGLSADAGTYVRLALLAGVGAERRPGGVVAGVQRVEGVARFHVDPLRQARRGVYFGGGLAVRHATGAPLRPALVALVGIEGRPHGGVTTAVEAGVGGGARLGLAFRGARRDRR